MRTKISYNEMVKNHNLSSFNERKEESKMNVREAALTSEESTKTKNVADLEAFDTQLELQTYKGVNSEGENFSYKYVEDDKGIRYRVPYTVLTQIKAHLEEDPDQVLFKVKKSGEGKQTTYTVVPVKVAKKK